MDQKPRTINDIINWSRSLPDDYVLTTEQACEFLSAHGISLKPNTLETWRSRRSNGPRWVRFPWRAVGYRVDDMRNYVSGLHCPAA